MSRKTAMHVFASLAVVQWAMAYIMTRIALMHFTVEAAAFFRYFVAAVSIFAVALIRKTRLPKLKDLPLFLAGGASGFAVYVYLLNTGSKSLEASVVSFIISASPIATALLARVFLCEKIGLIGWVSVCCAFSGVGVITVFKGGLSFTSGAVWICGSMLLISIYNILQRKLLQRYSPLEITAYCVIAGAGLLSVFAPQSFPQIFNVTAQGVISVVVLGVFSTSGGYLCWAYALSKADKTNEVMNYMFVTPIVTTLLGFLMINETPHYSVFIGGALVLAGVFLINRRKPKATVPNPAQDKGE